MSSIDRSEKSSLGHVPLARWEFDQSVVSVFSDMLERSIPQYGVMRQFVLNLGCTLAPPGTTVVDLGCSIGDGLAAFLQALGTQRRYLGVDSSEPMLRAARERFRKEIDQDVVKISRCDLRQDYPDAWAGLTLCVLTLQFTPIEVRRRILANAYSKTVPGGAIIVVEKLSGASERLDQQMVDTYHKFKLSAGYTPQEVERKRLSLQGVLIPLTAKQNEELLTDAGFEDVDCFWRWMNFGGWVATKRSSMAESAE